MIIIIKMIIIKMMMMIVRNNNNNNNNNNNDKNVYNSNNYIAPHKRRANCNAFQYGYKLTWEQATKVSLLHALQAMYTFLLKSCIAKTQAFLALNTT